MALVKAVATLRHKTNLPRDQVSNTFWFVVGGADQATAENVAEHVRDFYTGANPTTSDELFQHLSPVLASTGHAVKVYEYDETTGVRLPFEGAPPIHTEVFDFVGWVQPANGYPSEVALCLSYRNTGSSSVPQAQRRGRIYFGPLDRSKFTNEVTTFIIRPGGNVTTDLLEAAQRLIDLGGGVRNWVVYSRAYAGRAEVVRPGRTTLPALPARDGATYAITEFSVDNAVDIQRRRGEDPSARTTSPVV